MTDTMSRAELIRWLITTKTSYEGEFFPKKGKVSAVPESLPRFLVEPIEDKFNNDTHQETEFFKIHLQSDTAANLTTAIAAILGINTGGGSGFKATDTLTKSITLRIDYNTAHTKDDSHHCPDGNYVVDDSLSGVYGRIIEIDAADQHWKTFIAFDTSAIPQGVTATAVSIKVYAYNSQAITDWDCYIFGVDADTIFDPSTIADFDDVTLTTAYSSAASNNLSPVENWTAGTQYTIATAGLISIVNEIVGRAGYTDGIGLSLEGWWVDVEGNLDCQIYTKDSGNSNPEKYSQLLVTFEFTTSEYAFPFWIRFTVTKKNKLHAKAEIECEARWSI